MGKIALLAIGVIIAVAGIVFLAPQPEDQIGKTVELTNGSGNVGVVGFHPVGIDGGYYSIRLGDGNVYLVRSHGFVEVKEEL